MFEVSFEQTAILTHVSVRVFAPRIVARNIYPRRGVVVVVVVATSVVGGGGAVAAVVVAGFRFTSRGRGALHTLNAGLSVAPPLQGVYRRR